MSHSAALWLSLLLLLGNAFFVGAEFAVMAARRSPARAAGRRGQQARPGRPRGAGAGRARCSPCAQLGITRVLGRPRRASPRRRCTTCSSPGRCTARACPRRWRTRSPWRWPCSSSPTCTWSSARWSPRTSPSPARTSAALALAPPLLYITRALRPVIRLMEGVAKAAGPRCFGVEPKDELASAFTAEEVAHIVGREPP